MSDSRRSKKKHNSQEHEREVIKIQSWWRMVAARLELVRRWEKVQERERRAENAWVHQSGRHIDSQAANVRKALKDVQKTEAQIRTAIWQQYQRESLELRRYLQMTLYQAVYVYPRVFVEQREMIARQAILQDEFQNFLPFIEVQEEQLRLLLQGSEIIIRHAQYAKLERGWRQRVLDVPLDEMKARSAIAREEHNAWAVRLATFNRMKRALQQLQDIQELEAVEQQARENRLSKSLHLLEQAKEEELAAREVVRAQEAEAQTATFAQQQAALMATEAARRATAAEEVARDMLPLVEEAEEVARRQKLAEEDAARFQLRDRLYVQLEEAKERVDIGHQQRTIFRAVERQQLEDRQQLHLWDQGVLAEARARVGILFAERDDWFSALRGNLEGQETVRRQEVEAEELAERSDASAVHHRFLRDTEHAAERQALEEAEGQARALQEVEEDAERQFTVAICDFLWGDTGFRERLQRQEKLDWTGIEDLFHLDALQLVENLERTILGREEDLAWRFLWDKAVGQAEDVFRQALLGEEIREWRLLSVAVAKQVDAAIKEYSEALTVQQAADRAVFEEEEMDARQAVRSEQFQDRQGILEQELAERVGLLEAEEAEAERAADMRTAHAVERQEEELQEVAGRRAVEREQAVAFQFMVEVRKLLRLEENMRRIVVEEEQRRHKAVADRVQLCGLEVEEGLHRAKLAVVDAEEREELQALAVKGKAQAELEVLVNRARLDQEEELRHVEDFEGASRRRLETLEWQNFNPILLLALEALEHIIRKEVELWEVVGRSKRGEQEVQQRQEIREIEELAAQEVAAMQRQEALDRSRREWLAKQQRVHTLERVALEGEESRLRQLLTQVEGSEAYVFPFDRLQAEAELSKQLLAAQLGPEHRSVVELSAAFAAWAKGAVALGGEEHIERELLACELAESNSRVKQFTVAEAVDRAHLNQLRGLGAEEGMARQAIEALGQERFQGIAGRGRAAHAEQSRADVLQEYLRLRDGLQRFEAGDRREIQTQSALGLVEMEEPKYRRRLVQQERGAYFASLGLPYAELNETAWRHVRQQESTATLRGFMAEVSSALANEQLWLDQRELQIEEAKHRRRFGQEEGTAREELGAKCRAGAAAVRESELRRQAQRKQQAMERLHFNIIERDTRHSISHSEENGWTAVQNVFVQGYQEVVDRMDQQARSDLKRAKQKAEKAEKARREAQAREARLAELKADLDVSLMQAEDDPKVKPAGLVTKKREAWASADKVMAGDDPSAAKDAQYKRNAAGSPFKYMESNRSPLKRPVPVRRLESLGGQSLRSIYSHYCREYDVPTKPQVLAALPKAPGDFHTRHFSIGAKGSPLFTRPDMVVIGDVALGDSGLLPVLEVVKACPALHTLVLRGCGIQDNVEAIVDVALHHPCLTTIDLTDNPIASDGVQSLIHLASSNPRISSIQLDEDLLAPTQQVDLNSSIGSNLGSRGNRLLPVAL